MCNKCETLFVKFISDEERIEGQKGLFTLGYRWLDPNLLHRPLRIGWYLKLYPETRLMEWVEFKDSKSWKLYSKVTLQELVLPAHNMCSEKSQDKFNTLIEEINHEIKYRQKWIYNREYQINELCKLKEDCQLLIDGIERGKVSSNRASDLGDVFYNRFIQARQVKP